MGFFDDDDSKARIARDMARKLELEGKRKHAEEMRKKAEKHKKEKREKEEKAKKGRNKGSGGGGGWLDGW